VVVLSRKREMALMYVGDGAWFGAIWLGSRLIGEGKGEINWRCLHVSYLKLPDADREMSARSGRYTMPKLFAY
jgi:hypothetical protein